MRLGFCGVGKWASKLATAFRACGAEIVAFDRNKMPAIFCEPHGPNYEQDARKAGAIIDGFGKFMRWQDQLADKSIDAIIAVAPPEITTEVALACAEAGKPVMATKPLFDHPKSIRAPFYVDFWRLWSKAQLEPKTENYSLFGSGPFRDFPGAFDYGPHVIAAMIERSGHFGSVDSAKLICARGEMFSVEWESASGPLVGTFGNGADYAIRDIWGHEETPLAIGEEPKDQILQRFCQSFLSDVSEGFVDTRLLELSRRGMEELRRIREMAK